jgi:hypothetical protein
MCASERRSATDCLRCLLLSSDDKPTQQIRQVVQCGNTMYAAGSFWDIMQGGTTYTRHNVSSFSATVPCTITGWVPGVEGTYGTTSDASDTLNTIGFVNGNCADAYIGGKFTSVNGTRPCRTSPRSAPLPATWSARSPARPLAQTILGVGNYLLVGGVLVVCRTAYHRFLKA